MSPEEIQSYLHVVAHRPSTPSIDEVRAALAACKQAALAAGDQ